MSGDELYFIRQAFESNYIAPLGPMVDAFEQEFAGKVDISHAVALSSGTAALHLALQILGVSPGDEVFASTLTFIGSVTPITFQGATPVFIDSDRQSWNMDPDLLADELACCAEQHRLPGAVVLTEIYGQCADLDLITKVCDQYGIPIIIDAAEALGSTYYSLATPVESPAGDAAHHSTGQADPHGFTLLNPPSEGAESHLTGQAQTISPADIRRGNAVIASRKKNPTEHSNIQPAQAQTEIKSGRSKAHAVVYSFNGNKIITTSGGGMLASDDGEFIEKARFLSQQARDEAAHYEHSEIGFNYRMSNVLAAIGRGQLRVLDERVKRKREIFEYYQKALKDLPGIAFMPEAPHGACNRWLSVILITPEQFGADREEVRLALEAENIESRPVWKPMHLQPVFRAEGLKAQGSPVKSAALVSTKHLTPVKQISCLTGQAGQARLKARDELTAHSSQLKAQNKNKRRYPARVVGGAVAEDLFARGLCLPSGTAMSESDMERVVSVIRKCCRK